MTTNNSLNINNIIVNQAWTPTVVGAAVAGTTTYTTQFGYYNQIGNLVIAYARVNITAATGTGDILFNNLPLPIKSQTNGDVFCHCHLSSGSLTWPTNSTQPLCRGINNTSTAKLWAIGPTPTSGVFFQMANTGMTININLVYQTS